jgi:hypothetical protein
MIASTVMCVELKRIERDKGRLTRITLRDLQRKTLKLTSALYAPCMSYSYIAAAIDGLNLSYPPSATAPLSPSSPRMHPHRLTKQIKSN